MEFREASGGHEAYLYTERATATSERHVFTDGPIVGRAAAEDHLRDLLARVRAGEQLWW